MDSDGQTLVTVDSHRMYYLITKEEEGHHELLLISNTAGLEVYSFSFGNRCLEQFDRL